MNAKEEIEKIIGTIINGRYHELNDRKVYGTKVFVEISKEMSHGDYSTNVALILPARQRLGAGGAKKMGKKPVEIAKEIVAKIKKQDFLERIEVAGPGFINFYLSKEFFTKNVGQILKEKDKFGKNNNLKNQKTIGQR